MKAKSAPANAHLNMWRGAEDIGDGAGYVFCFQTLHKIKDKVKDFNII